MITVLRLGHRKLRDARISTHCGLVARAFGADCILFSGERDEGLIKSLKQVVERWGNKFEVSYEQKWKRVLREFGGIKVHLTMYGLPFQKLVAELREKVKESDLLVVIGSEKVPAEVYKLVDYNLAITSQPHSEVAALAVFLHELHQGKELELKFEGAKLQVVPSASGKKLIKAP